MSDDLMRPIYEMQQNHRANRGAAEEIDAIDQVANHIEAQAAEIARLRAEVAAARREGMEEAARIADSCAADWTKSAKGKYVETKWDYESRADAGEEIAAAIRAAAKEGKL